MAAARSLRSNHPIGLGSHPMNSSRRYVQHYSTIRASEGVIAMMDTIILELSYCHRQAEDRNNYTWNLF